MVAIAAMFVEELEKKEDLGKIWGWGRRGEGRQIFGIFKGASETQWKQKENPLAWRDCCAEAAGISPLCPLT
jgi:hypothetical protein